MPRKKQTVQKARRRKAYSPRLSAEASSLRPTGVFRVFSSYRTFAIIGAAALVLGYVFSFVSGGTISAHGGGRGGSSVRGDGFRREAPDASDESQARVAVTIKQYATAPAMTIDPAKRYTATISMDRGVVEVELLAKDAPQAVNNFVFLAREGFYDGVSFHRVIPGFVAQAGDPTGTGIGGPGYDLPFEATDAPFEPGVLAVAKPSEAGTPNHGSQFFFALGREPTLDGKSTVFGRVIRGMEVLAGLTPRDPQSDDNPPPGSAIESIAITES